MMTTESPYERVEFDDLAIMVNPGQREDVACAFVEAGCRGRWEDHRGGILKFRDGSDERLDHRIIQWTFYAETAEDAMRGQSQLDLLP